MLQLFLNDLSIHRGACEKSDAVGRLKAFCSVLQVAHGLDVDILLNSAVPVAQLQFGDEWPLARLRNDRDCLEENRYLKRLQDRAPFDIAIQEAGGHHEVEYLMPSAAEVSPGAVALGLGLAHLSDGLSISFDSHPSWREREIRLSRRRLNEKGDLLEDEVRTANAVDVADVQHHQDRFLRPKTIDTGAELWDRRGELFPCLSFIPRTRAQIESLMRGEPELQAVIRKLMGLNDAVSRWRTSGGDHPVFPFKARPESESRLKRGLVDFQDESQVSRSFSWHCDFTPGEGRIHFILESQPKRTALIGHVGAKLGVGID